jgi:hypothetical protein
VYLEIRQPLLDLPLHSYSTLLQKETRSFFMYSRIISTEAPSFFMTAFSASVTKLTTLLSQSRDCSCYVSRRVLAPPPLWLLEHNYIRAHDLAHSPDLWHRPRLLNISWSRGLCGIAPVLQDNHKWFSDFNFVLLRAGWRCSSYIYHNVDSWIFFAA